MPNWTENSLSITGLTEEQTTLMETALAEETFFSTLIPEPDWKTIPNDKGELPQEVTKTYENGKTHTFRAFPDGSNDDRWYGWRNQHWGIKWDVSDTGTPDADAEEGTITASFLTPWCPPQEGLQTISSHFPEAKFVISFSEAGNDFVGALAFKAGKKQEVVGTPPSELRAEWFEANHPELYAKAEAGDEDAEAELDELWGDNNSDAICEEQERCEVAAEALVSVL